jgi:lipopolysaccharide transport system ATP-binding protein
MYIRLAFAVAAHLDTEILLVDEVLAVGDAQFQKKCMGKMEDVATKEGRTICFVSHNMGAIQRLCNRTLLLSEGQITEDGQTASVIEQYLALGLLFQGERVWKNLNEAPGDEIVRMTAVRAMNNQKKVTSQFSVREPIYIEIEFSPLKNDVVLDVGFFFNNITGTLIFTAGDYQDVEWEGKTRQKGVYRTRCEIPGDFLNEGEIRISSIITTRYYNVHVMENDVLTLKIVDNHDGGGARGGYTGSWPGSIVRPFLKWSTEYEPTIPAKGG